MITAIEMAGIHYTIDDRTRRYIMKKIARLDKFLPAHARSSATADVKLRTINKDHGNKYMAEVILSVPNKRLTAKDSTMNMLAAIDIVEAKLVNQLRKYKQHSVLHIANRRLLDRFKRSYQREQ